MALSNWLTRQEWNACYFLGAAALIDEPPSGDDVHNLSHQLRAGIGVLHRAGYKFTGIDSTPDGDFEKREMCCSGNESVLADLFTGAFEPAARAREVIPWLKEQAPTVDIQWLADALTKVNQDRTSL